MNAVTKAEIEKISRDLLDHFTKDDGELILNTLKGEEDTQKSNYKGREILELLQNAVDALDQTTKENKIYIKLSKNTLSIYNTGIPFELDGLKSLAFPHNSPKDSTKKSKFIGHKGLGFRSVLNWSEKIKIYSKNGLAISYDKDRTNQFYRSKLQDNSKLKTAIFPTLSYPEFITQKPDLKDYATVIELDLISTAIDDVKKQISEIESTALIFLPDVSELIIENNGETQTFSKQTAKSTKDHETIILGNNGETKTLEIYKKSGPINTGTQEDYEIKIALNNDLDINKNYLYSYFKTKIKIPIHWHIHATFDLNSERNEINETAKNTFLVQTLRNFLFETAEKIAQKTKDYEVAKSLYRTINFDNRLDLKNEAKTFDEIYLEKYISAKIFPTMSGDLLSIKNNPRILQQSKLYSFLNTTDPKNSSNSLFRSLLKPNLPTAIYNEYRFYMPSPDASELFDYIDRVRRKEPLVSDLITRAELAFLIYLEYHDRSFSASELPSLFVTNSEKKSTIAQDIYIGSREEIQNVPSFITFKFMNEDQYNYILKRTNCKANITATDFINNYGFAKFYNLKTVTINSVLEDANHRLKTEKDEKKLQSKFTEYLDFITYHTTEITDDHKVYLMARDNQIRPANNLYFGIEYNEELCENLFDHQDSLFLKSSDYYHQSIEDLKQKLSSFVATTPRRQEKFSGGDRHRNYYKYTYDHFDLIINSKPQYFFKWLLDTFSKVSPKEIEKAILDRKNDNICEQEYSELYNIIKLTPVFKTKNSSYDFNHVLENSDTLGEKVEGLLAVKLSDYFKDLGITNMDSEIEKIISLFKIPTSYKELSPKLFYKVLQALPSFDYDGKVSTSIYNSVTRDDEMEKKVQKENKLENFLSKKDFKVFTNHGFVDTQKATYAIYKEPKCFDRVVNFIKMPKHTNKNRVKTLFDVDTFDRSKIEIVNNPKEITEIYKALTADLDDLKAYLLAIRLGIAEDERTKNRDENRVKNLNIIPTSKVLVSYNGNKPDELDELDFLRNQDSDEFYIVINEAQTFKDIKANPKYVDAMESIIAIEMDADRDLDIIWKMVNFSPRFREEMYLSEGLDPNLLKEARERLGIIDSTSEETTNPDNIYQQNLKLLITQKETYSGKFFTSLYEQIKKSNTDHEDFRKRWFDYNDFLIPNQLDPEDQEILKTTELSRMAIDELIKKYFTILDLNIEDKSENIYAIAAKNRKTLHDEHSEKEQDLVSSFLSEEKNESLLYFDDKLNLLRNSLNTFIEKELEKESKVSTQQSSEIITDVQVEIAHVTTPHFTPEPTRIFRTKHHRSTPTTKNYLKKEEDNIAKGGKAEYAVRKALAKNNEISKIKWHSAYATNPKYANEFLEASSDDSVGYDLSYEDQNGIKHYIEVKFCNFTEHNASITISKNEFDFANAHPDTYDLYLVKDVDIDPPKIKVIDSFCQKDFVKSAKNYDLTFTFE